MVTGLGSCARASTAAESRYRLDAPVESRQTRVIALDDRAAAVLREIAGHDWAMARFFVCESVSGGGPDVSQEFLLRDLDGAPAVLPDELDGAHVVLMVAASDDGAGCAHAIGEACWERSVMTAGAVLGDGVAGRHAVAALRPHARVLLPSADEGDVVDLLTALRA